MNKHFVFSLNNSTTCPISRLDDYTCKLKFPNDEFDCDGDMDDRPKWCPITEINEEVKEMVVTKHVGIKIEEK